MSLYRRVEQEERRALTIIPVAEELTEMAFVVSQDSFTTLWSYTLAANEFFSADAAVMGCRTSNIQGAKYLTSVMVRNNGGVSTKIGESTAVTIEDVAGWDTHWLLVGSTISLQVTGSAAGVDISWFARIDYLAQIV